MAPKNGKNGNRRRRYPIFTNTIVQSFDGLVPGENYVAISTLLGGSITDRYIVLRSVRMQILPSPTTADQQLEGGILAQIQVAGPVWTGSIPYQQAPVAFKPFKLLNRVRPTTLMLFPELPTMRQPIISEDTENRVSLGIASAGLTSGTIRVTAVITTVVDLLPQQTMFSVSILPTLQTSAQNCEEHPVSSNDEKGTKKPAGSATKTH